MIIWTLFVSLSRYGENVCFIYHLSFLCLSLMLKQMVVPGIISINYYEFILLFCLHFYVNILAGFLSCLYFKWIDFVPLKLLTNVYGSVWKLNKNDAKLLKTEIPQSAFLKIRLFDKTFFFMQPPPIYFVDISTAFIIKWLFNGRNNI